MKDGKYMRPAVAKIDGWWIRNMVALVKALHYGRAAQRDERNGFPFTAAMEWHHAAELFLSGSFAAEYCWGQWGRIMHLPRELAGPIGSSRPVVVPLNPASSELVLSQIPLATAAQGATCLSPLELPPLARPPQTTFFQSARNIALLMLPARLLQVSAQPSTLSTFNTLALVKSHRSLCISTHLPTIIFGMAVAFVTDGSSKPEVPN